MQVLNRRVLAALVILGTAGTLGGQTVSATQPRDSVKVALIHEIIARTHAVDQAMAVIEAAVPAQRAANPRIPAVFWDRFLVKARAERGQLEDLIGAVYERHFSATELRELLAFYETPTGQKILATLPDVMQESVMAGQTWGRRIGAAVGAQLAAEGVRMTP